MKTMGTSFKRPHACSAALSASSPEAGHLQPMPLLETPGHSWACLGQFLMGTLLLSPASWCTQGSVCALQDCVSPVLCKFRGLYGGVNGNLLQKVQCTHCCTQCPRPCSRPLPIHASAGASWTLMGMSGSVSCGVTASFSWVLVGTRFCLCHPKVCFPSPV